MTDGSPVQDLDLSMIVHRSPDLVFSNICACSNHKMYYACQIMYRIFE